MSKLNINRNVFLEKEELVRLQDFLINDTVQQVMLDNTSSWGIVRTVFTGTPPDFLIEVGTNVGTVKLTTASKAVDSDKLLIKQAAFDNLAVPNDSSYYWVKISHQYLSYEEGTCSVNINGEVVGVNTKFTEILRGQSTEVPVKILFKTATGGTPTNDQLYEVVSVTDDLNILLSGVDFAAESNLIYIAVGTTALGETVTSSQLEGLYKYDACNIEFIAEESLDTPPVTDYVADKEFYIARVINTAGTVTVQDKRASQYLTFNVEGMADKLSKTPSDWSFTSDEKVTARGKLDVLSAAETQAYFGDSGWQDLTKGVAAWATGFEISIRRIGKHCIVQGTFLDGAGVNNGAIIATIPYTLLAANGIDSTRLTKQIRFPCGNEINTSHSDNRGMFGYIPASVPTDLYIELRVESFSGLSKNGTTKFNLNFSFFLD